VGCVADAATPSNVVCGSDDTDGFFSDTDVASVTINADVTVDDSGNAGNGAIGGAGLGVIELRDGMVTSSGAAFTDSADGSISPSVLGDFTNNGSIVSTVSGSGVDGVFIEGSIAGTFTNNGDISAVDGVFIGQNVETLINNGMITGALEGVDVNGNVASFTNSGTIIGDNAGVSINGDVGIFTNNAEITADGDGVNIQSGAGTFTNAGEITSNFESIFIIGDVEAITNSGTITSVLSTGVTAANDLGTLTNSGTISASNEGVQLLGNVGTIINSGTIIGESQGFAPDAGFVIQDPGIFIVSNADGDTLIENQAGALIEGTEGILSTSTTNNETVINTGTITGTLGIAANLGGGDDTFVQTTTGVLNGSVDFGDGFDTLAFDAASGETGNAALFTDGTSLANDFEAIEKRGAGTFIFEGDALPDTISGVYLSVLDGTAQVNAQSVL